MADTLASKIRKARVEAGMSREKLAGELGVSLATVVRLETGRTQQVSTSRLMAVSKRGHDDLADDLQKIASRGALS